MVQIHPDPPIPLVLISSHRKPAARPALLPLSLMPETSHCEWVFSCRMTRASQYLMLPWRRLCDLCTEVLLNGCGIRCDCFAHQDSVKSMAFFRGALLICDGHLSQCFVRYGLHHVAARNRRAWSLRLSQSALQVRLGWPRLIFMPGSTTNLKRS